MKLAKLSLAAIMTFGAISVVNAQPLEEAFKDVEFTGFLRYRNDQRDVDGHSVNVKDSPTINQNDWDFMSKFSSPVGDNFKVVTVFASSSGGTKGENQTGNSNTELKVDLRKAFLAYGKDDLTVEAGQMAIGHPIFDNAFNGNKGNGVIGKYAIGQVTLASSYFAGANVWDVGDASSAYDDNNVCEGFCNKDEGSITTAAITGSFSDLEGQFWYAKIQDYIEAQYFAQADAKVAMFNATAQFINTTLDDNEVTNDYSTEKTGTYYALKANAKFDMANVNIGYTANDENQGIYSVAGGDSSVIHGGWRLMYDINNVKDLSTAFFDAGVKFDKFGLRAGYANASAGTSDLEIEEMWGEVSYKVSSNLNTYLKYSNMSETNNGPKDNQVVANNRLNADYVRFETKYTF